jgi:hypothetical protein
MRILTLVSIATCFFAALSNAQASSINGVPKTNWTAANNSVVTVVMSGTTSGTIPSCSTAGPNYYALDASTVTGSNMQKMLYAAQLAGASVNLLGTGSCTLQNNIETIAYIQF